MKNKKKVKRQEWKINLNRFKQQPRKKKKRKKKKSLMLNVEMSNPILFSSYSPFSSSATASAAKSSNTVYTTG